MRRAVVAGLLGSAACLSSPPGAIDPDGGDAAVPCAGLELLVESFEEDDPEARFLQLWDPGSGQYGFEDGSLTLTAQDGEAQINTIDSFERVGAIRFEAMTTTGTGGFVALNLSGAPTAARISINDTTLDLYLPNNQHMEIERDSSLVHFSLGFVGREVVLAGSADGLDWTTLWSLPDAFVGPIRVAIAVHRIGGDLSLRLGGINAETAPACL